MARLRIFGSLAIALIALWSLALPASAAPTGQAPQATYRVTIKNLAQRQMFSPGVFVVHKAGYRLFQVGVRASEGVRRIAEDGAPRTSAAAASGNKNVVGVQTTRGVIHPAQTLTVQFNAPTSSLLSLASMLEQTNDGFVGVDSAMLPATGSRTLYLRAYDAGTEANNELRTHVPGAPFAGFRRAPTSQPIVFHPGIRGVGHLNAAVWGWKEPIARLTIERIK